MAIAQNFAANMRHMMAVRRLTQREMAEKLESKPPYVNRVLSGEICPSLARCDEIARILRVPLADMLLPPRKLAQLHPVLKSA